MSFVEHSLLKTVVPPMPIIIEILQKNRLFNLFFFMTMLSIHWPAPMTQAKNPTVDYRKELDGSESPSATSILTNHQTTGRFGTSSSGGYLAPSLGNNSRFNSGATFSPSGSFIGLSTNTPNSRFQSIPSQYNFQSGIDYSLYRDFVAMRQADSLPIDPPRQVQAQSPSLLPEVPRWTNAPYYASGQFDRDFSRSEQFVPDGYPTEGPLRQPAVNQQIWMRGSGPVGSVPSATNSGRQTPSSVEVVDLGSRMGGNLSQTMESALPPVQMIPIGPNGGSGIPLAPPQQANPTASLGEYLELLLLRSPQVNPVSPIQVIFDNGTATVRGIVPTQSHRMEAGRLLLTDPRVKKVNNLLSVLPTNTTDPLPEPFDPNLEQK